MLLLDLLIVALLCVLPLSSLVTVVWIIDLYDNNVTPMQVAVLLIHAVAIATVAVVLMQPTPAVDCSELSFHDLPMNCK